MKIYDDIVLVEEYKKCGRCRIVAEKYGCSDETVRRALIKCGVPRIIRHPRPVTRKKATESELKTIVKEYYETSATINDLAVKHKRSQYTISEAVKKYGHGMKKAVNSPKITDEELAEESKIMTCLQIAKRHGISTAQLCRRAKKAGIDMRGAWRAGRWKQRAIEYGVDEYDDTITLDALIERDKGICQICGKPVDKNDILNGHIRRLYPTLDHIIPLSKGGKHVWGNVQLAHMCCNAGKCDKVMRYGDEECS